MGLRRGATYVPNIYRRCKVQLFETDVAWLKGIATAARDCLTRKGLAPALAVRWNPPVLSRTCPRRESGRPVSQPGHAEERGRATGARRASRAATAAAQ